MSLNYYNYIYYMINDEKKTITEQNNSKISLSNSENYYNSLSVNINDILLQQINILEEYIKNINDIFHVNKKNKLYIIIKGIETIFHIYQQILFYTNNHKLAYYYSHKSIYLYKEYNSQITDDSNSFLNLTTRDAIIYIYKKTIFEIKPNLLKKDETNKQKEIFDILFLHNNIIKLLLSLIYKDYDKNIHSNYLKLINNIISYQLNYSNYCNLSFFTNLLFDHFLYSYTNDELIESIEKFCKKINKHPITTEEINKKLINNEFKQLNNNQLISLLFN
jgi:hypothetical protein